LTSLLSLTQENAQHNAFLLFFFSKIFFLHVISLNYFH
jgi:hypothetical protein